MNSVIINLSNRHLHVNTADCETLFGKDHALTRTKDLVQPGQFACAECVTLKGPKGSIANVRVLGPLRPKTQVEILRSDVFTLGITTPPVRESGKIEGSSPVTIVGPAGTVELQEGLIIAMRHIHMLPADAADFNVSDTQIVSVRTGIAGRLVTFHDVIIRVSGKSALECHIDFDEGNACGIGHGTKGEVIL